jgi:hypothetical protein
VAGAASEAVAVLAAASEALVLSGVQNSRTIASDVQQVPEPMTAPNCSSKRKSRGSGPKATAKLGWQAKPFAIAYLNLRPALLDWLTPVTLD